MHGQSLGAKEGTEELGGVSQRAGEGGREGWKGMGGGEGIAICGDTIQNPKHIRRTGRLTTMYSTPPGGRPRERARCEGGREPDRPAARPDHADDEGDDGLRWEGPEPERMGGRSRVLARGEYCSIVRCLYAGALVGCFTARQERQRAEGNPTYKAVREQRLENTAEPFFYFFSLFLQSFFSAGLLPSYPLISTPDEDRYCFVQHPAGSKKKRGKKEGRKKNPSTDVAGHWTGGA